MTNNILQFKQRGDDQLIDLRKRVAESEDFLSLLPELHEMANQYPEVYCYIGWLYEEGDRTLKQDYEKAFYYYQLSVDEVGFLEGILSIAKFYYYGLGLEKDYEAAYGWYFLAAEEADNAIAQMMLGRMHHLGIGVEIDYTKAEEYYRQSVEKGYVYAMAFLGQLKETQGERLKGFLLRYKAGIRGAYLAWKNKSDIRLRRG